MSGSNPQQSPRQSLSPQNGESDQLLADTQDVMREIQRKNRTDVRKRALSDLQQSLSPENAESSPDPRLEETQDEIRKTWSDVQERALKSWSGTSGDPGMDEAISDMNADISSRLIALVQDCIQQVLSAKQLLRPNIAEIKGSSDEITERLQQSRKQALVRKEELEAERLRLHQAACNVLSVLNDVAEGL